MSDSPITIARFDHPTEANLARMRLESEGVPAFLQSLNHASANWIISGALGGIQLQVPPSEVARAREILDLPAVAEISTVACPECASENVHRSALSRKVSLLSVHLFAIPLPFSRSGLRCAECGHTWEPESDT